MKIHRAWQYSHNTFITATCANFLLANKIIENHAVGLIAEALLDPTVGVRSLAFINVQKPYHIEYVNHLQLQGLSR